MKRNGYGWFSREREGHQTVGFFIDNDNRIIYWPSRKAPGFVLDEKTASLIFHRQEKDVIKIGVWSALVVLIWIAIEPLDRFSISYYFAIAFPLYVLRLLDLMKEHKCIDKIIHFEKVNLIRPKAEKLKPSERMGIFSLMFSLAKLFIGFCVTLYFSWGFFQSKEYMTAAFVFLLISTICCSLIGLTIYRQKTGLSFADLNYYQAIESFSFYNNSDDDKKIPWWKSEYRWGTSRWKAIASIFIFCSIIFYALT